MRDDVYNYIISKSQAGEIAQRILFKQIQLKYFFISRAHGAENTTLGFSFKLLPNVGS